jgi:hypothetical protein
MVWAGGIDPTVASVGATTWVDDDQVPVEDPLAEPEPVPSEPTTSEPVTKTMPVKANKLKETEP